MHASRTGGSSWLAPLRAWGRRWAATLPLLPCLLTAAGESAAKPPTVLTVRNHQFFINDHPTFLLGFSYYGALGASREFIRQDLQDMQQHGFNWLRVWATWGAFGQVISAVDGQGDAREPYFSTLTWLIAECDARGMIVDVTLSRHQADRSDQAEGQLPNRAAHRQAVEVLVSSLRKHRNWYLDLANERDVGDARFVGIAELKELRELARRLDPALPVTASFGGHDLGEQEIRDVLDKVGVDFLAPHRPRHAESPGETEAETRRVSRLLTAMGRTVPIHYQEPFRRGYTRWQPAADDFVRDLRGAVRGGAAGWCFHNGTQRGAAGEKPRRSFDLREQRLWEQLDAEERQFLDRAAMVLQEQD